MNKVYKSEENKILTPIKRLFLGYESTQKSVKAYENFEENIYLQTKDNEKIGAFIYKPKIINGKTAFFIFCHGKGCERADVSKVCDFERISNLYNACFVIIDYRGFGDSSGEYTIKGVNYDVLAAYEYLINNFNPSTISIIGHSLGSAVALEYGKFSKELNVNMPARIYCLAPFISTIDICKDFKLIFSFLLFFIPRLEIIIKKEFNYDNLENARFISNNIFIFHGSNDKIINLNHGKAVAGVSQAKFIETKHTHISIFTDENTWKSIMMIEQEFINNLSRNII